jgi:hypothetical protein
VKYRGKGLSFDPRKLLHFLTIIPQGVMEQSLLIELIRTLNQTEKDLIRQFAALPFFNQGKMKAYVPGLLNICLSHHYHDPQIILDKKTVFSSIFPNQEFVDGKLEKTMVEAHKVVRTVLLVQQYLHDENDFQLNFDYAKILRAKRLDIRYQLLLAKLQKLQEETEIKDSDYLHQQYILEYSIHDHVSLHNQKKGDLNVLNTLEALELYSHLNRLALSNRFLLQEKIVRMEVSDEKRHLFEDTSVPEKYLEAYPTLKVNHAIFQLLKKALPVHSDIHYLFQLLQIHEKNLDHESLQEFYTYLRNICILVLSSNSENIELEKMLHDLYKDNLERGYLHNEGKLVSSRYWAVSSNALRVKEFDWALEFIEKYKYDLIGENESHDIYRLNVANYLFYLGRFSECLDYIPATSPYVDYLLTGKRLELKAYYELKSDLFSFKLEAFKVFLSRTSPKLLSEAQKQSHLEFVNLLLQLHLSLPGDQKRAEKVISRVQERKQAGEWRWLLEKAKALKQK